MSSMWVDIDAGIGGFASINAQQGYRPNPVVKFAIQLMRATRDGGRRPAAPAGDDAAKVPKAQEFAGTFTGKRGTLEFAADGERLFLMHQGRRLAVTRRDQADQFCVEDAAFDRFALKFGRTEGKVVEVSHGGDWYAGAGYAGERDFPVPAQWNAFVGHYRNDNPWAGSLRIYCLKGQLMVDGTPLAAEGDLFRLRVIDDGAGGLSGRVEY